MDRFSPTPATTSPLREQPREPGLLSLGAYIGGRGRLEPIHRGSSNLGVCNMINSKSEAATPARETVCLMVAIDLTNRRVTIECPSNSVAMVELADLADTVEGWCMRMDERRR